MMYIIVNLVINYIETWLIRYRFRYFVSYDRITPSVVPIKSRQLFENTRKKYVQKTATVSYTYLEWTRISLKPTERTTNCLWQTTYTHGPVRYFHKRSTTNDHICHTKFSHLIHDIVGPFERSSLRDQTTPACIFSDDPRVTSVPNRSNEYFSRLIRSHVLADVRPCETRLLIRSKRWN